MFDFLDAPKVNTNLNIHEIITHDIKNKTVEVIASLVFINSLGNKVLFSNIKKDTYIIYLEKTTNYKNEWITPGLSFFTNKESEQMEKRMNEIMTKQFGKPKARTNKN
jgi:hypothetical protein